MSTLAAERLKRLLFLVPYISRHPGQTVDEVARAVGCSKAELLEELDLVTLVGHPPFQPDDFVDVYVEDDGRVYVQFDQRLSAPPRLTAAEGVALASAASLLKPEAGSALASGLEKLKKVLPPEAAQRFKELQGRLDVQTAGVDGMTALTQAIVEHREVEFDYVGVARGEHEHRVARPLELKNHRGQWYLRAHCLTRNGERLFRLDRLAALKVNDQRFTPESPTATTPRTAEKQVTVRFTPEAAPYQQERFGSAGSLQADGSLIVTVPGESEAWLARWVLSFGGEATVLAPEWAIRVVAEAAKASLQSV